MPETDAKSVLSFYALTTGNVRRVIPLENAGGWGGLRLWRAINQAGAQYCLRRWPVEHPAADRLRLIHAVLNHIAPQMPIVACPFRSDAGPTFVEHAGHLWELTNWLPGVADYHAHP